MLQLSFISFIKLSILGEKKENFKQYCTRKKILALNIDSMEIKQLIEKIVLSQISSRGVHWLNWVGFH